MLPTFSLPLNPAPLKAVKRVFFVLFHINIWSPSTIYPPLNLLDSHFPSHLYPTPHIVFILQSSLSLLVFKLMFKGVFHCMPTVGILYFLPFNPVNYSPLPLYLPIPIFNSFQYTSSCVLPGLGLTSWKEWSWLHTAAWSKAGPVW
jgi:hypothetical protein